jgi:hypothetical protein
MTSPPFDLLSALLRRWATVELLLLTAWAELVYLHTRILEWRERVLRRGGVGALALSGWELGLLAARSRGYHYWTTGTMDGELYGRRSDAPRDALVPASDLAQCYWDVFRWYRGLYLTLIDAARCLECGKRIPARAGSSGRRGGPPKYCSDRCRRAARARQNRDAQRQHRKNVSNNQQ